MAVDREVLARELRAARENRGISQQAAAERAGLSRTVIAQIELGNRPVSPDELAKLAAVYRRPVIDLLGQPLEDDDVLLMLLDLAPELVEPKFKTHVRQFLLLCREAIALEAALGWSPRQPPPQYDIAAPRNAVEAIEQGERIAAQERQRIGMGAALPVENVSALAYSQGVRVFAADLPDNVTGLAVHHRSIRPALLVNRRHGASARRLSLAHEYAHALFDRKVSVTKRENSAELTEKRANAFASGFLLPRLGVEETLSGLNKGLPSRRTHVVFAVATGDADRAEVRSTPGSQTVTWQDVATVARRFEAPYGAVVFRLLALGLISEADSKDLLRSARQAAAGRYESLFGFEPQASRSRSVGSIESEEALDLKAEVVHLAVEAYRRQAIDKDRLGSLAKQLDLPELSDANLLEFAEAAR
jgi:Zn-dependent peptidase ImmA (M78 family)/transcriptional regulator with XRE-family HTH domain